VKNRSGPTAHKGNIYQEVANQVEKRNINKMGFEERHLSFGLHGWLDEMVDAQLIPTVDVVESIRMIKDPEEIENIRKACRITDEAYLYITKFIKEGHTELEVARSEEHTSELQSRFDLVCRLLL